MTSILSVGRRRTKLVTLASAQWAAALIMTVLGELRSVPLDAELCSGWVLCQSEFSLRWLRFAHLGWAPVVGLLVLWTTLHAWRRHRGDKVLLPLTTVTAVLIAGQALAGGVLASRGAPQHLVVLHRMSAFAVWIALTTLVLVAGLRPTEAQKAHAGSSLARARDFLALGKPIIVALLLLTTFAGLVAGGRAWPPFPLAAWTLIGGALAAAGSSALNQYIDRNIDRNMQRTSRRPLAAGRLTPAEGLSFGLALCLASYYVLACFVNFLAAFLSLAGIIYYVLFYSMLLKMSTVQNIVIGGGAGAIPPMVGWAAATGRIDLAAWILFGIVFMWTPPHFWALALVRRRDYERAGVPMLPAVHGERATRDQILIYTIFLVAVSLLLVAFGLAGVLYTVSALALGGLLLLSAYRVWRWGGNRLAWMMYRWSSMYLALLFLAIAADALL